MNQYEIAVLYHPDLEIDLEKSEAKVTKLVTDNGGKVVKADNWGKRKLAYKIKGNEHGVYVFYEVELPAEGVQKVELSLNITDEVIRFLIVKPDTKAKEKAEAIKAARAAKRAKSEASAEQTAKTEENEE